MCTAGLVKTFAYFIMLGAALVETGSTCQFDKCYATFHDRLQGSGITKDSNPDYCQLLTNFNLCLHEMTTSCWGVFYYHSAITYIANQKSRNNCSKFPETLEPREDLPPRCHYYTETVSDPVYRYCSLFGSRHLRTFNGSFETCARPGAYSFFDSKHFVIQITHSSLTSAANALTKVTVIIKECGTCTQRKHYEAGSDNENLSWAFVDGTTFDGDSKRKAVEIVPQNHSHVEIHINHIATKIIISRRAAFLAVSLLIPEAMIKDFSSEFESLCNHGCSGGRVMQTREALANPAAFTRCHGLSLKTPVKITVDRCAQAGVTDAFFDACVFDLMTTGNEMLVSMASDAQTDISLRYPIYLNQYRSNRTSLSVYNYLTGYEFRNCVSDVKGRSTGGASGLLHNLSIKYQFFLLMFLFVYYNWWLSVFWNN
ncbi:unnamed protein product [Enterobius vermicularis]|uniref:RGM domain family member B n=1 Tax=Enterobius vermicularis TaxID=51028 RepID=A0A0N4VAJ9_ENTVE|nr:unnamed protein product [Enterobius vermicularis]